MDIIQYPITTITNNDDNDGHNHNIDNTLIVTIGYGNNMDGHATY